MPNSNKFSLSIWGPDGFHDLNVICDQVSYDNKEHMKFYNIYDAGKRDLIASFPYSKVAIVGIEKYVEGSEDEEDVIQTNKVDHNVTEI